MTLKEQIHELDRCVAAFASSVAALDERLLAGRVTNWTARDIVAHLIGWNRYVVKGAEQILHGQLPFYDVDPGPNYAHVNAVLVRECTATTRSALLEALTTSTAELVAFLRSLDPDVWNRDFGVRYEGELLTVKSTVDDLIADYHHHRAQLEEFRDGAA